MNSFPKSAVAAACQTYGPQLVLDGIVDWRGNVVDPILAMWAFSGNESSFGADCDPRFEPAYFSGRYSTASWQAELNEQFGQDAAKSYGCWQVMLCNCPTGMTPSDFEQIEAGAQAFVFCMNRMVRAQQPKTLDELADMYNTGNWRDRNVPEEYIAKLRKNYDIPMVEATGA